MPADNDNGEFEFWLVIDVKKLQFGTTHCCIFCGGPRGADEDPVLWLALSTIIYCNLLFTASKKHGIQVHFRSTELMAELDRFGSNSVLLWGIVILTVTKDHRLAYLLLYLLWMIVQSVVNTARRVLLVSGPPLYSSLHHSSFFSLNQAQCNLPAVLTRHSAYIVSFWVNCITL